MLSLYSEGMRISTIVFVYVALAVLWSAVAQGMQERHQQVDRKLQLDVAGLWGKEHVQSLPRLESGKALVSSDIQADLKLEYRKKGHYWYSTYLVDFRGAFQLEPAEKDGVFVFPLPVGSGMFSGFQVEVDGEQLPYEAGDNVTVKLPPHAREVVITYTGQGCDRWWLNFEQSAGSTRNLRVILNTNFSEVDFSDGSVSPISREIAGEGSKLVWEYENLLTGGRIGLQLPHKTNPGPALIDICRYAPMALLLFFGALTVCGVTWGKLPHPVHYCFLGAGFFSFHLLLVYLGDVLPLGAAFSIAAIVALFVCLSYGSRILDGPFVAKRLFPALLLYLVGFSSAFLVDGFKGLPLVVILVLTLHMTMQLTAGIDWAKLEKSKEAV